MYSYVLWILLAEIEKHILMIDRSNTQWVEKMVIKSQKNLTRLTHIISFVIIKSGYIQSIEQLKLVFQ